MTIAVDLGRKATKQTHKLNCSMRSSTQENLSSEFENNKGADQTAYLRSLISAYVISLMDIIICNFATGEIEISM